MISGNSNSRSFNLIRSEGTLPAHLDTFPSEDGGREGRPQRPERRPESLSKNRWLRQLPLPSRHVLGDCGNSDRIIWKEPAKPHPCNY